MALPPAIFKHVVAVLSGYGGAYGSHLAQSIGWIRSAALPTNIKLPQVTAADPPR
jgi:hypothetical protein